jgi:outer membrane immunogenic protein
MRSFSVWLAVFAAVFTTPVFAADMAVKAPPVAVAAPQSWTGFYLGVNAGGAWANTKWVDGGNPPVLPGTLDASYTAPGFIGGGQAGFNYQIGGIVLGVEGGWDWANLRGHASCFSFGGAAPAQGCDSSVNQIGMVTGRVGAVWNDALFYVKAGEAWVHDKYSNPCTTCFGGAPATWFASDNRSGGTIGAGVEIGLGRNWSAKVEYDYLALPSKSLTLTSPAAVAFPVSETLRENIQMVEVGINRRFDWGSSHY